MNWQESARKIWPPHSQRHNVGTGGEPGHDPWAKDYWVVPNQKDVRPYAVLMQECDEEGF